MQENYELVQKGFRIFHPIIAGYIGLELNREYHSSWWDEVLYALSDQRDLPESGTYDQLIDSLDIANCLRLIDRKWNEVFRDKLSLNCRTWAKELMGVRNTVAHIGQQDISQADAERALDTMMRLCRGFDDEGADEIQEIYTQVREQSENNKQSTPAGPVSIDVPNGDVRRADLISGEKRNLLNLIGTDAVQKTTLTRKVAFAGKTQAYPVYKVRLDALYYNDQNDRIATWITRYRAENGSDSLSKLVGEEYNGVIENFIYESNPESIVRTQNNIALVGQREPGVALADGRIVDGNRRYTCLRRIQRDSAEPIYFETVIMDVDIQTDKKQIKLLELAIQHGEEKKVDYDLIDYAIGTYMDIERTKLLTVEEYATSTNESIADVKKRIDIATVICEFLEYIRLPEQFHVAREYQVYSLLYEMMPILKQLSGDERNQLKTIVFNNVIMKALLDQRKFIRDLKLLIKNDTHTMYFEDQVEINEQIHEKYDELEIKTKTDIDNFARDNDSITEELQLALQRALLRSRRQQLKAKPAENVAKSVSLMTEFDARMFDKMDTSERKHLKREMDHLSKVIESYKEQLDPDDNSPVLDDSGLLVRRPTGQESETTDINRNVVSKQNTKVISIAKSDSSNPLVLCYELDKKINTLSFSLSFGAFKETAKQADCTEIKVFFIDNKNEIISNVCETTVTVGDKTKCNFVLNGRASEEKEVYLVIKNKADDENEALRIVQIEVAISFSGDFDF